MDGEQVLVVFHSSSGNTRKVAQAIAEPLSADIEQIREVNPRRVDIKGKGLGNFFNMGRAVFAALTGRATPIEQAQYEPADYSLVVVGTPVYAGSVPGPVRAYLAKYQSGFKGVAFFCTGEDPNNVRVFAQMEEVCGRAPKAVLAFHAPKVRANEFLPQVEEFIASMA
jgi:menaquinone-dependent protoporphyrinogen IX oxidase